MELQLKSQRWMCLPTAFAMALDMPVAELLLAVGHDGSKIIFPGLDEPICRRGFHIQELIDIAVARSFAVTPIELCPVMQPTEDSMLRHTVAYREGNWRRFTNTIAHSRGVIDGAGFRCGHSVAYDHGHIFDPDGPVYDYSRLACEAHRFYTRCAWRIDPMEAGIRE
jgi:hypothetical protein